jgi:hypothetical protein
MVAQVYGTTESVPATDACTIWAARFTLSCGWHRRIGMDINISEGAAGIRSAAQENALTTWVASRCLPTCASDGVTVPMPGPPSGSCAFDIALHDLGDLQGFKTVATADQRFLAQLHTLDEVFQFRVKWRPLLDLDPFR